MCEFCTQHGEGKKWYLQAENYIQEVASEERRQIQDQFSRDYESLLRRWSRKVKPGARSRPRQSESPLPYFRRAPEESPLGTGGPHRGNRADTRFAGRGGKSHVRLPEHAQGVPRSAILLWRDRYRERRAQKLSSQISRVIWRRSTRTRQRRPSASSTRWVLSTRSGLSFLLTSAASATVRPTIASP